jgi:dipeptidyl aminopeptidase/acylaminoacyl peptidase
MSGTSFENHMRENICIQESEMSTTIKQYGLWESPISPITLGRGITLSDIAWDEAGILVWRELRSDRGVLVVQKPDGQAPRDLNDQISVRARVGYGGGDFTVGHGQVYFVEGESGRIYRQPLEGGEMRPVTPGFGSCASPTLSPDGNWLVFVHTYEGKDCLAVVDAHGKQWPIKLVEGDDFYMQPCWHPSGKMLAWIAWNFPNMPWDGTVLRVGRIEPDHNGSPRIKDIITLAGDERTSIFQPHFSPDGRTLAYVSDANGWWQIYLYDLESMRHQLLTPEEADHGLPAWIQGMRTYGFSPDSKRLYYLRNVQGFSELWQADLTTGEKRPLPIDEDYTWMEQIAVAQNPSVREHRLALLASGSRVPPRLITFTLSEGVRVWRRSMAEDLPPEEYSNAQAISWQGMDGNPVYGLYYPPTNPRFEGIGKPPLIVLVHGGPTSQRRAGFNSQAQFFTSRGYAVLDVNYRGSTGYGRAYWEALKGNWGIYDVQDAVSGASSLVEKGLADAKRLVIMGGSAGGFTVLKALEDYPGFFKAGVCLYGVTNQFTLAEETHKFESRYLDTLLGPLPQASELYRERSPLFFVDKIRDAVILFQGQDDQVVPRAQSDALVASLQKRGVPHEYHVYPGEGHGFRKTETIEHFYRTVERFLRHHVIFA